MKFKKTINIIFSIFFLIGGVFAARYILSLKSGPSEKAIFSAGPLVEAINVTRRDFQSYIETTGVVKEHERLSVISEAGGRIIWKSPLMEAGRAFKKGALLFRLEDTDYLAEVAQAKAQLEGARLKLSQLEASQKVAKEEWARLHPDGQMPDNPLVFLIPQIKSQKALIEAKKALLQKAYKDLSRTRYYAPFDGIVLNETVDVGRYVRKGEVIGELLSSEKVEVIFSLSSYELGLIRGSIGKKSQVYKIIEGNMAQSSGTGFESGAGKDSVKDGDKWIGVFDRILASVDKKTRMAKGIIEVYKPFSGEKALRIGDFVRVKIPAKTFHGVFIVPSYALKNGHVWVVRDGNLLHIAPITLLWRNKDLSCIDINDISPQIDKVSIVISNIGAYTDGMRLRPLYREPFSSASKGEMGK